MRHTECWPRRRRLPGISQQRQGYSGSAEMWGVQPWEALRKSPRGKRAYRKKAVGKAAVNKKDLVMAMFGVDTLVEEVDKEAVSLQCGRACGARSGITQKGNLTPTLGFRE